MKINGKSIILTGASSGFGKELLNLFVNYKDVKVIAVSRNIDKILINNDNVILFSCDLSIASEVDRLFSFAKEKIGVVDIFIANTGFGYYEKIVNANWQHIENIFNLNVISPIYSLEKMIEQKSKNTTSFVFVASAGGLLALPGFSLYSATKYAINGFAENYKYECDSDIKVSIVYPIAARTNFFNNSAKNTPVPFPSQKISTVAKAIIKAIETGKRKVYSSKLFRYSYPLLRAFPFILSLFQAKQKKDFYKWLKTNK